MPEIWPPLVQLLSHDAPAATGCKNIFLVLTRPILAVCFSQLRCLLDILRRKGWKSLFKPGVKVIE